MDFNATFICEILVFFLLVYLFYSFFWPNIDKILLKRQAYINEQLNKAYHADAILQKSRIEIAIAQKEQQRINFSLINETQAEINEMKKQCLLEIKQDKIKAQAQMQEIKALELEKLKNQMKEQMINNTVLCIEKILKKKLSPEDHYVIIEEIIQSLA